MALFDLQNDARPTGQPQLDYEPHTFKLHRDELGAPLLAAGVSPPPQHVSILCRPNTQLGVDLPLLAAA